MPTYEYRCNKCAEHFEVFQSFSDEPLKKHPGCGGKVVKVLSPAGIVFSGSGFYKTDNRSSGKRSSTTSTESSSSSGDAKTGDAKTGDAKTGDAKKSDTTKKGDASSSSSESKKTA